MNKPGSMLSDVLQAFRQRPATECYPQERPECNPQLRGLLHWDMSKCTGCGLCALDCPANAIQVEVIDRKARRIVIRYFADRCAYCAQCIYSCRQGAIESQPDVWELAALERGNLEYDFGDPEDIDLVLAGGTETGA
ncbi:MAG: 4Fe-4S binding protein [Anaerolineales bacterium]|nr:4Fe-4S binding protein [Anaerolineales bacterium]